jgi:hypothetical protein
MAKITATVKFDLEFELDPNDFPAWATEEGICKLLQERINDMNGLTFAKIPELFGTTPSAVWEEGVTVDIKP